MQKRGISRTRGHFRGNGGGKGGVTSIYRLTNCHIPPPCRCRSDYRTLRSECTVINNSVGNSRVFLDEERLNNCGSMCFENIKTLMKAKTAFPDEYPTYVCSSKTTQSWHRYFADNPRGQICFQACCPKHNPIGLTSRSRPDVL